MPERRSDRDLLILGVGGNSREVAEAAQDSGWRVLGFLDDDQKKRNTVIDGLTVLGPISLAMTSEARCVCTLATYRRPQLRAIVTGALNLPTWRWATIVHPAANITRSASLEAGSIILAGAFVGAGCHIGGHTMLLQGACVSHDCVLENSVTICSSASLAARVNVKAGAYIGMGAMLLGGVTVGSCSVVGMGAVVTKDIPADCIIRGTRAGHQRAADSH